MNLIAKILKESEEEDNLFKPRKIEGRLEAKYNSIIEEMKYLDIEKFENIKVIIYKKGVNDYQDLIVLFRNEKDLNLLKIKNKYYNYSNPTTIRKLVSKDNLELLDIVLNRYHFGNDKNLDKFLTSSNKKYSIFYSDDDDF